MHQKFSTLEDISNEWHIRLGTARNRLMLGQNLPPSIKVGRRRLFPVTEFEQWVASVITPLQEAVCKDAVLFSNKPGHRPGRPRKVTQEDCLP